MFNWFLHIYLSITIFVSCVLVSFPVYIKYSFLFYLLSPFTIEEEDMTGGGVKIITKEKGYLSAHLYLHSSYSRSDPETIAPEVLRPASLFRLHPRDTLLIPSPYHPIRSQDTPPSQDTRDIQDTRPICPQ